MTDKRFTVDGDGKYWDKIRNEYVTLDTLFRTVEELDKENKQLKYKLSEHMVDLNNCTGKCSALEDENEQLKQAIAETEKMVQSTYDELTKLRCIKKNLGRIKSQWGWIMEAVQYD